MTEELRKELGMLLKRREIDEERIEELAYMIYKAEEGNELDGLNVDGQGYKKVLKRLGYVV